MKVRAVACQTKCTPTITKSCFQCNTATTNILLHSSNSMCLARNPDDSSMHSEKSLDQKNIEHVVFIKTFLKLDV